MMMMVATAAASDANTTTDVTLIRQFILFFVQARAANERQQAQKITKGNQQNLLYISPESHIISIGNGYVLN